MSHLFFAIYDIGKSHITGNKTKAIDHSSKSDPDTIPDIVLVLNKTYTSDLRINQDPLLAFYQRKKHQNNTFQKVLYKQTHRQIYKQTNTNDQYSRNIETNRGF